MLLIMIDVIHRFLISNLFVSWAVCEENLHGVQCLQDGWEESNGGSIWIVSVHCGRIMTSHQGFRGLECSDIA